MGTKTDTHLYDGKLKQAISPFQAELAEIRAWEEEKKERAFFYLRSLLGKDRVALHYFDLIVADGHSPSNFDPSNGLWADELLLALAQRQGDDLASALAQQLRDMRTGSCPQGRTHRLFQLVLLFEKIDL